MTVENRIKERDIKEKQMEEIFKKVMELIEEKNYKLIYFREREDKYIFGIEIGKIGNTSKIIEKSEIDSIIEELEELNANYWMILKDEGKNAYILEVELLKNKKDNELIQKQK